MARARLIALAVLAACRASDAQPLAVPSDWRTLPEIAKQLGVDGARAWGDPARGCYAVDFALSDLDRDDALAHLRAAGFTIDDAGAFARGAYRGRLRLDAGGARACFWNDREPDACAAACTQVLT
jgi:hypothetical protein